MDERRLRRLRAEAQLLYRRTTQPAARVVEHLLAVQAQELRSAHLAVRARGAATGLTPALTDQRDVVVTWLCRGTLHAVTGADLPWLLGLTAPAQLTTSRRRLSEEGFDPDAADRAVGMIEALLADKGPLTRREIVAELAERGVAARGQAAPHLLRLAALRGIVVQGPVTAGGHAFALTRDWLGAMPAPLDPDQRDTALAELALRYLRGHGPASAADLAAWAGLPLRDARAGLAAISSRIVDTGTGLVDLPGRAEPTAAVPPRLLPSFDPYLLGWRDRGFAVPAAQLRTVHPGGGVLRAVAVVDGTVVGTWGLRGGAVRIEPFDALDDGTAAALAAEAAAVTDQDAWAKSDS